MIAQDLLRKYILEMIEEMRNANVPNQLRSPKGSSKSKEEEGKEDETDEASVTGMISGPMLPLGYQSPVFSGKSQKKKKSHIRFK